jgi:enoyl-CoA hydratase/carnithine racemase
VPNYFKLQKEDGVAVLTFDRDEERNPFKRRSPSELEAKLVAVRDDARARALLLTGSGNTF